jgi:hypothetical protein
MGQALDRPAACITMNYMMRWDARNLAGLPRWAVYLFVLGFFAAVSGAPTFLHHHDDHSSGSDDCQTCYLIKIASVALTGLMFIFVLAEVRRRAQLQARAVFHAWDRLTCAAPRAPPLS